ncbi:MAG: flavodoxin family protein [Archaeoglobus sp.]|uniref:hypothetical protein n=1 Tax=Archaeoglobus sp. TaxID=1872626 RepID=UPI001D7934CF|nr:hypothetical protein [Archaeoglobus sp.]MBO8179191.1 flavodoxin family protein [Archaeoglobus sp.]
MEIYYYTFTGNSRRIAEILASEFDGEVREIKSYKLPYILWLILSFIPYLGVKIDTQPPSGSEIVLCFPKWTLNCPPVTAFFRKYADGKKIKMVICYGGFDEKRYAEFYLKFAIKYGALTADTMLVKRRELKENEEAVKKKLIDFLKSN